MKNKFGFILVKPQIGENIEQVYDNKPQDIEGAYFENEYYVVQTRPQVWKLKKYIVNWIRSLNIVLML